MIKQTNKQKTNNSSLIAGLELVIWIKYSRNCNYPGRISQFFVETSIPESAAVHWGLCNIPSADIWLSQQPHQDCARRLSRGTLCQLDSYHPLHSLRDVLVSAYPPWNSPVWRISQSSCKKEDSCRLPQAYRTHCLKGLIVLNDHRQIILNYFFMQLTNRILVWQCAIKKVKSSFNTNTHTHTHSYLLSLMTQFHTQTHTAIYYH